MVSFHFLPLFSFLLSLLLCSFTCLLFNPRTSLSNLYQMNAFAYIFTARIPIFTFPANKQPYIVMGNYVTAGFGFSAVLTILAIRWFYNRDVER